MPLAIIFATTKAGLFGRLSKIPWNSPNDMKFFKNMTKNSNIFMGKKTAESLNYTPLPDRKNHIVTNDLDFFKEGFRTTNYSEMIDYSKDNDVFVIGGSKLIQSVLDLDRYRVDYIYHTIVDESLLEIKEEQSDDVYFNIESLREKFFNRKIIRLDDHNILTVYCNTNRKSQMSSIDEQYLNIAERILKKESRQTRNAKTRSLFDSDLFVKTNFRNGFPVLQSKNVWMYGVIEELDFFWEGKTDSKELENKGIKIWQGNTSREFLDSLGKDSYEEGMMGPMYGYQWRFFNKPYNSSDGGTDQLENLIQGILRDPFGRRHLITTYNPSQAEEGVLFPCHGLITQLYVEKIDDNLEVSLKTYQRSADWFLGVPFNLSSYSYFLLRIIEELNRRSLTKNYIPGEVTTYFGDAHIYEDHVPVIAAQILYAKFTCNKFDHNVVFEDKKLLNYFPLKKYIGKMMA